MSTSTIEYPAALHVQDVPPAPTPRRPGPAVDQVRYLAGAALSVGIAALTALLGVVVTRGVLHLPAFGSAAVAHTLPYVLGAAGVAVAAALLFDAVLHVAPHPTAYFGALVGLGTALAVAIPFAGSAGLAVPTAVALTNVAVGVVIGLLVPLAAGNARR